MTLPRAAAPFAESTLYGVEHLKQVGGRWGGLNREPYGMAAANVWVQLNDSNEARSSKGRDAVAGRALSQLGSGASLSGHDWPGTGVSLSGHASDPVRPDWPGSREQRLWARLKDPAG